MGYNINEALERLEQNLKEVNSAKKQVETTVATSERLQQTIERYSKSLADLNDNVQNFILEIHYMQDSKTEEMELAIKHIKALCEKTVGDFSKAIENSTSRFHADSTKELAAFKSTNNRLTEQICKLTAFYNPVKDMISGVKALDRNVDSIKSTVSESQATQNRELSNIKGSIDSLASLTLSQLEKIKSAVGNNASNLEEKAKIINAEMTQNSQQLNGLKVDISNLRGDVLHLQNVVMANTKKLKLSADINRWIIIIGFSILIALHFAKL